MKRRSIPGYTGDMGDYIRAYSDIFIQYLLGRPEHQDLLLDFLNSVQDFYGSPRLTSVEVKNPDSIRTLEGAKFSVLDIKARGSDQRWYNVEVQSTWETAFPQRSLYYWAKLYSDQLEEGDKYRTLNPAICINILNFQLFPDLAQAEHAFLLTHRDHPDKGLTDHLQIHYLELPKITLESAHSGSALVHWLAWLKYEGRKDLDMEFLLKDMPALQKAHTAYEHFSHDQASRFAYQSRMAFLSDQASREDDAEQRGLAKGRAEGRAEAQLEVKLGIARTMAARGMTLEDIRELTGLDLPTLENHLAKQD